MYGFWNADSNFKSGSALFGYAGLHAEKTGLLIKYTAKGASFSDLRFVSKTLRGVSTYGRILGFAGTAASVFEDYNEDKLGAGTVFKAALGTICAFNPVFGLGYAVFDLAWGAATGTTFTDSVANGIDNAVKKY